MMTRNVHSYSGPGLKLVGMLNIPPDYEGQASHPFHQGTTYAFNNLSLFHRAGSYASNSCSLYHFSVYFDFHVFRKVRPGLLS